MPISLAPGASQAVVGSVTEALGLQQSKNLPHATTTSPAFLSSLPTSSGGSNVGLTIPHFTTITGAAKPPASFPTAGSGAIDALKSLASAALDSIHDAQDAATALAGNASPSSEDVSNIAGALSDAFGEVGTLDAAAENIELSSFSGEDLQEVSEIQSKLGNTLNLLRDLAEDFGAWISRPAQGISQYRKLAAQLALLTVPELVLITNWHSSQSAPTSTSSSSAASASSTGNPNDWVLNTVPGTTVDAFEKFVNTLPDKGSGARLIYPGIGDQVYFGKMTLAEAQEVSKNPIVDQITPNLLNIVDFSRALDPSDKVVRGTYNITNPTRDAHDWNNSETSKDHRVDRRQEVQVWEIGPNEAQLHQKLLSLPRDRNLQDDDYVNGQGYLIEETMGEGSYVYILDTGLAKEHVEFSTRRFLGPLEWHIAKDPSDPSINTGGPWDDATFHGTSVSSMVIGARNGVAQKVTLVMVKIASADVPQSKIGLVLEGWRWAIEDIINRGRKGKAVISFSMSQSLPFPVPVTYAADLGGGA